MDALTVQAGDGGDEGATRCANRLAEASYFLMDKFPDFPDLYNPVEEALAKVKAERPSKARVLGKEIIIFKISKCKWMSIPFFRT